MAKTAIIDWHTAHFPIVHTVGPLSPGGCQRQELHGRDICTLLPDKKASSWKDASNQRKHKDFGRLQRRAETLFGTIRYFWLRPISLKRKTSDYGWKRTTANASITRNILRWWVTDKKIFSKAKRFSDFQNIRSINLTWSLSPLSLLLSSFFHCWGFV